MAVVTSAVVGIAAGVASAAQGFSAAAKAKKAAAAADAEAKKAMQEAKAKAEVDMYAGLNVPLDAYEAEFENNLAVAQQNTEALQEGDSRSLAAGVGRIGAQGTAAAEGTRIAMGEEISDLNMMKADSKDAINQQLIGMDVAYAKEQNQRMRDSEAARAQGISQGISGVSGALTSAASLAPLYGKAKADRPGNIQKDSQTFTNPDGSARKLMSKNETQSDYEFFKKDRERRGVWD